MSKKNIYNNPIVLERADPWVYKHTDGYYYFTGSVPGYQEIEVRRAKNLNELEDGEKSSIWHAHKEGEMSKLIWAPEIHFIQGKWYIYFAAASDDRVEKGTFQHRMYVLECEDKNPLIGDWIEKGQVKTAFESFSLDATTFELHDRLYYVWAQKDPVIPGNSNLYISEMENPWTLTGSQILLSLPEYDWEKVGFMVNEGPAVVIRNGKVFITYSASATDENYCMGLLWANVNDNLLNGYNWHKSKTPVFVTSEEELLFGPGHNSFTMNEDGEVDVLIFHARPKKVTEIEPLDVPDRHAHAKFFTWDEKGFPLFNKIEVSNLN